jgi:hypothetical protein
MEEMEIDPNSGRPRELRLAYMIAFFAAVLSIVEIGGGKFRDREIVGVNQKMTAYSVYYNKLLKETLLQGERDLLQDLLQAGAIVPKDSAVINRRVRKFNEELVIVQKQMQEIVHGANPDSAALNGIAGTHHKPAGLKGIKGLEYEVERLNVAGDNFHLSSLLLELSLVLGAIGFLAQSKKGRNLFKVVMVFFGLLGIAFGVMAYYGALSV